jgi:hypothetical protein
MPYHTGRCCFHILFRTLSFKFQGLCMFFIIHCFTGFHMSAQSYYDRARMVPWLKTMHKDCCRCLVMCKEGKHRTLVVRAATENARMIKRVKARQANDALSAWARKLESQIWNCCHLFLKGIFSYPWHTACLLRRPALSLTIGRKCRFYRQAGWRW